MNQKLKKIIILIICLFVFNMKIQAIDDINEQVPITNENNIVSEIDVPDTLSSKSVLLMVISMFDIALGIGIINYVKKNKIQE